MRNILIGAMLAGIAVPASAATIVDTGMGQSGGRPVNSTTTLLGQFSLGSATRIEGIETYGRVVTSGSALYSIYSSVNNAPGALLYSASTMLSSSKVLGYSGISGLAFDLLAGTYFVGFGQGNSAFTAYVRRNAPNPLGFEGSFKPQGYVATNAVDLSWRLTGQAIAGGVPEPTTWAMMLGGIAFVGGAARYRRGKRTVSFA